MDIKTIKKLINFRSRPLIFLDLELTGLEVQKHEILEVGALKVSPQKPFIILEEMEVKVKPQSLKLADKSALKIAGYSKEEWQEAISLKEALDKLDNFAKDGILVGYNVTMDWAVLDRAYFSLGRQDPFHYHRLDVLSMAYLKLRSKFSLKKFSLSELCKVFQIPSENRHRALVDAKLTYEVFKKLVD